MILLKIFFQTKSINSWNKNDWIKIIKDQGDQMKMVRIRKKTINELKWEPYPDLFFCLNRDLVPKVFANKSIYQIELDLNIYVYIGKKIQIRKDDATKQREIDRGLSIHRACRLARTEKYLYVAQNENDNC